MTSQGLLDEKMRSSPLVYLWLRANRHFRSNLWLYFVALGILYLLSRQLLYVNEESNIKKTRVVERILYKVKEDSNEDNIYIKGPYWKRIEPFTHKEPSGFDKFVIFDCAGFSGSLQFLNNIPPGWSVFVINNMKDAQLKTCPKCISFSKSSKAAEILENIRHSLKIDTSFLHLPIVTKMAASIFAIKSNAPWIYATDKPITVPFDTLTRIIKNHPEKGIVYSGPGDIFNPCGHFMDPSIWAGNKQLENQSRYVLKTLPATPVYQIVDNCRRGDMGPDWQRYMDPQAPIPYVLPGKWTALDFQNFLIPLESAWTLVASIKLMGKGNRLTPTSSKITTALSLLVQRVLWETDSIVGFVPEMTNSNSDGTRTHCPTCDLEKSIADVLSIGDRKTIEGLSDWKFCGENLNVVECLDKYSVYGFVNKLSGIGKNMSLKNLIGTWAKMMREYKIAHVSRLPLTKNMARLRSLGNAIYFTPAKSLQKSDGKENTRPLNQFKEVCKKDGKFYSGIIPKQHPKIFNNIVLVISFNSPRYLSSISYIEFIFGRHFKHIVYCATGQKSFEDGYQTKYRENPVTFIDVDIRRGDFGHLCVVAVSQMNYHNVTGYLYLSDDVILNVWNLYNHPFHLPWFQADIRIANLKNNFTRGHRSKINWYPWTIKSGKRAITKSIDLLKSLKNNTSVGTKVRWFLKNLRQMSSGCDNCIAYMDSDLYYLPAYMAADFRFFVPYFTGVFQELSVPTLLAGITPQADLNIYRLRGSYLVGEERKRFWNTWSYEELFVHPVKYSELAKPTSATTKFLCDFVRRLDEDLLRS